MRAIYPFTAIVGQERMKRALILNAVDPRIRIDRNVYVPNAANELPKVKSYLSQSGVLLL